MAQLLLLAAPEAATVAGTYGRTPLHLAAGIGHAEMALQLVAAAPAAATVADMDGCTPLHLAALYGHAEMVQPLAAAPETAAMVDAAGWTPLAWPAREGHTAVVQLLLASGQAAPPPADMLFETLRHRQVDAARCLVAAGREPLLVASREFHDEWPCSRHQVLPLFGEVAARLPLERRDWRLVPCRTGLAAALPAGLMLASAEHDALAGLGLSRGAEAGGPCRQQAAEEHPAEASRSQLG